MTADPQILAEKLWRARRQGTTLTAPPDAKDESWGYAVQDAIIAAAATSPAGWKVGAASAAGPKALGLSGPFAGPLWEDYMQQHDSGPVVLRAPAAHGCMLEVEIAFRVSAAPRSTGRRDVIAAVDAAAPAVELAGNRFTDPPQPPGPATIADHAGNSAVALGRFETNWRGMDLASARALLLADGEQLAAGDGGNVMGDPVASLTWLAQHLEKCGRKLAPGQVVMSGALIPLTAFEAGRRLDVSVDGFAPFSVVVEEAGP